jgi:hypothetical protein
MVVLSADFALKEKLDRRTLTLKSYWTQQDFKTAGYLGPRKFAGSGGSGQVRWLLLSTHMGYRS